MPRKRMRQAQLFSAPGCNHGWIMSDSLSTLPAKHFVPDYGPDATALSCTSRSMAALNQQNYCTQSGRANFPPTLVLKKLNARWV